MIELVGNFRDFLNDNSGTLQIELALLAFLLAYKGYVKVLEQIKISIYQTNFSNQQQKIANDQRTFELRIQVSTMLLASSSRCALILTQYKNVINEYEFFTKEQKRKNTEKMELIGKIEKLIIGLRGNEQKIKSLEGRIKELNKNFKEINIEGTSDLEIFLISATRLSGQLDTLSQIPERYLISLKKIDRNF